MAQRVTIRKRTPYNTRSNRRRQVKTPGGRLVYHHLKKQGTAPKCGDCGIALPGVGFVFYLLTTPYAPYPNFTPNIKLIDTGLK